MKLYKLLAIVSVSTLAFQCQTLQDCSKYKTGKFYFISKMHRTKVLIERTDSLQVETDTKTGEIIKNRIDWKTQCEYDIYQILPTERKPDKTDSFFSVTPIQIRITDVGDDYYICIASIPNSKYPSVKDTMWVSK